MNALAPAFAAALKGAAYRAASRGSHALTWAELSADRTILDAALKTHQE